MENDGVYDDSGSNFGIATFDNMILGFVTVFQMVTLEGWSDIMYNLIDASVPAIAVIYCTLVVVIGSFFLLNVVLAVIMESFEAVDQNAEIAEKRKNKEYHWLIKHFKHEDPDLSETESEHQDTQNPLDTPSREIKSNFIKTFSGLNTKVGDNQADKDETKKEEGKYNEDSMTIVIKDTTNHPEKSKDNLYGDETTPTRARKNLLYYVCYSIQCSNIFTSAMVLAIIVNTFVLSLDRYPISNDEAGVLEAVNGAMTYVFLGEMIIMITGLGPNEYSRDSFNLFDATVVVLSIVELIIKTASVSSNSNGAFSALRAVRLLRVFKLARSWVSFRQLLSKMIDTLGDI
jgi:hypothetical protein